MVAGGWQKPTRVNVKVIAERSERRQQQWYKYRLRNVIVVKRTECAEHLQQTAVRSQKRSACCEAAAAAAVLIGGWLRMRTIGCRVAWQCCTRSGGHSRFLCTHAIYKLSNSVIALHLYQLDNLLVLVHAVREFLPACVMF